MAIAITAVQFLFNWSVYGVNCRNHKLRWGTDIYTSAVTPEWSSQQRLTIKMSSNKYNKAKLEQQ